ncbi:MAG: glycosyltransferase [Bacteroidetes bacterium]|nr:glycosyltransferase [Bacteroidota bacterium]
MKKRIYINPTSSNEANHGLVNPYIDDLVTALSNHFIVVNKGKPSKKGILDFLIYFRQTDYYHFNWIEKLPTHRYGLVQTFLFLILIRFLKISGKKVIWTMHNKLSHTHDRLLLKKVMFRTMLKHSDIILAHSSDAIHYGSKFKAKYTKKIHYFPHPVKDRRQNGSERKEYDILIWGSLTAYKGTHKFLKFIHDSGLEKKYKIYIIGKAVSQQYLKELQDFSTDNIIIENKFTSDEELRILNRKSKIVLFIYTSPSILGSGVLMDSLGFGANIIGPDAGAFKDLSKEHLISTFTDFDDLISKIDHQLAEINESDSRANISEFLKENSWDKFAENLCHIIESQAK